MHSDPKLADTVKLELPQDLLTELKRRNDKPQTDLHVEGWKVSLLGRLIAKLSGVNN
jgi:hypothetical protein